MTGWTSPVRAPRGLGWGLWTTTVLLVASAVLLGLPGVAREETTLDGASLFVLLALQALTFATVGLVLARARPRNAVSWLFCAVGVFVGLHLATARYQHFALVVRPGELPLGELAAWLQAWLYVPALGIFVSLLPLLFPTGRPISWRWYPALALAGLAFIGMVLTDALQPGRINQSTIQNPVGISPSSHLLLGDVATVLYLVSALVGFGSLMVRWRRADSTQRQQLKWFAYFAATIPVFILVSALIEVYQGHESLTAVLGYAVAAVAFLGLPIATAISILRYQLYDIDLVINRTLVYGALTVTLAICYLGLVLLSGLLLRPLADESDLAVAVSTLAVAALFRPARARIQAVVDHRFYRRRYDATRTLEVFTGRLRDELDLDTLDVDLRRVVQDTMHPSHVSLWLRGASS